VVPWRLDFICRRFGTFCYILIGGVSRDETARLFVEVKVWLKNSLSQSAGKGRGRECPKRGKDVEGNDPKWIPVVRETSTCQREEGELCSILFQEDVSFL
jgi:hypothetical protein